MTAPYIPSAPPAQLSMTALAAWNRAEFARIASQLPFKAVVDPREYGLSGKGETNEFPQFQKLLDGIPDRGAVLLPHPNFKVGIYQTPAIRNKTGVAILSLIRPVDDAETDPGIQLIYGGDAGAPALGIYDCGYLELGGFTIHANDAGVGIDVDQTASHRRICTALDFNRLHIMGNARRQNWTAIRIGATSKQNVEYMRVRNSFLKGNAGQDFTTSGLDASMKAGSNLVSFATTQVTPAQFFTRARFCIAGPGPDSFAGRLLDARVLEVVDERTIRIDQVAQIDALAHRVQDPRRPLIHNTVPGVRWMLEEGYGFGFVNGSGAPDGGSYNAKRQILENVEFKGFKRAIFSQGGGVHAIEPNFVYNDYNWWIEGNQSQSSSETRADTEGSRMHAVIFSQYGFASRDSRYAIANACPGAGFIAPGWQNGGGPVKLENGSFDGDVPSGSAVYELGAAAGIDIRSEMVRYPYNYGLEELGFVDALGKSRFPRGCTFEDAQNIQSGRLVFKGGPSHFFGDVSGGLLAPG